MADKVTPDSSLVTKNPSARLRRPSVDRYFIKLGTRGSDCCGAKTTGPM